MSKTRLDFLVSRSIRDDLRIAKLLSLPLTAVYIRIYINPGVSTFQVRYNLENQYNVIKLMTIEDTKVREKLTRIHNNKMRRFKEIRLDAHKMANKYEFVRTRDLVMTADKHYFVCRDS